MKFAKSSTVAPAAALCCALTTGCADDGAPQLRETSDADAGTMTATDTMLTTSTTSSASSSTTADGTTSGAGAPAILDIDIVGNPLSVLSATIEVTTDVDTTMAVTMTPDGGDAIELAFDSGAATTHAFPVLGMKAEGDFSFEVTVTNTDGLSTTDDTVTFTTEALPDDLPPMSVQVDDDAAVSPGVTIFNVFRWTPSVDADWGYIVGLDEAGDVVWYYEDAEQVGDVRPSADGNLLIMNEPSDLIHKIDMMGNELWVLSAQDLGIDSFHHEMIELPGGNLAVLGSELRSIDGYQEDMMTVAHDVVADTIVEFSEDGTVVDQIEFFDLYDPLTDFIEPLFSNPFWDAQYPNATGGTKDWTHGNALIYDEADDAYIVSVRHLLLLAKVSRSTGALVWSLGENRDFTLAAGGQWQYAQHAPELQADGSLLVYDNGNLRPLGMGESNFSRCVVYDIDESGMEVTQTWAYPMPFFTPILGDCDRMGNGNVLVTAGGQLEDDTMPPGQPDNRKLAQIIEVTADADPSVVSTVTISDESTTDPTGYSVYRAEKIPSLYQVE